MTSLKTYNRISVGERIKEKRIDLKITQEQFAEKIGISYKFFQDIERGSCGMSLETMLAIASQLNISLDYFILGKGTKENTFTNCEYVSQEFIPDTNNVYHIPIEYQPFIDVLQTCTPKMRLYALDVLKVVTKNI